MFTKCAMNAIFIVQIRDCSGTAAFALAVFYDHILCFNNTKGQKKLLDEKLRIRNTYAHPSSLTLSESKVNSFVEDLIVDIVSKIK